MTDTTEPTTPGPTHLTRVRALDTVAAAASLLFKNGQTTEHVVLTAERLGHALGLRITLHPHWGGLTLQVDGTPFSETVPAMPLGVDMGKVLAIMKVVDQVCDGRLPHQDAHAALVAAGRLASVSTPRFALFAAIASAAMGVIFGALDPASLLLMAASAGIGALARRGLATFGANPFAQPLCAAAIAGAAAAAAGRLQLSGAPSLVALCPCMVLVPGPHILNSAFDLARARIDLGIARLTYAGLIVLMICAGLLAGLAAGGESLPPVGPPVPVPLAADVIAAGFAVAGFGTFFSMPWRLLPIPIAVGMLAHAARWALISLAGAHVAVGALGACVLVAIIVTLAAERQQLPFAALGFSAVVSMMPGFFLFRAASGLIQLVSIGPQAPADLLTGSVANGVTAFLIILAMGFGLILPHMQLALLLREPSRPRQLGAVPDKRSN